MDFNNIIESADEIIPGLWLGNEAISKSKDFMIKNNISLIVNATKNIESSFLGKIHYIRVPVDDPGIIGRAYPENENVKIMKECLPLILNQIYNFRKHKKNVLVHCHAGAQRSAIIVLAYLLYRNYTSNVSEAIEFIIKKRSIAFFGGKSVNFIKIFE